MKKRIRGQKEGRRRKKRRRREEEKSKRGEKRPVGPPKNKKERERELGWVRSHKGWMEREIKGRGIGR